MAGINEPDRVTDVSLYGAGENINTVASIITSNIVAITYSMGRFNNLINSALIILNIPIFLSILVFTSCVHFVFADYLRILRVVLAVLHGGRFKGAFR